MKCMNNLSEVNVFGVVFELRNPLHWIMLLCIIYIALSYFGWVK